MTAEAAGRFRVSPRRVPLTEPPQTPHDLPLDRLEAWLAAHVAGFRGPLAAARFAGGQSNPTYKLTAASGVYVLRRKPLGPLLPSAHAVDREYRVMRALSATAVPVPQVHALCENAEIIGSAFYVMEFLDGRIFWDQRLPEQSPAERRAMFASMNAVIAALHARDHEALGLADFGRPGNYMARQIARWSRQYQASQTDRQPAMDALIEWLPRHLPPEAAPRLVHGDYRMDNLVFHKSEPRVIGVLDWELSTIGDPLADFAYHVMTWRVTPELFRGLAGVDFAALGIPSEAEYIADYCRQTGRAAIADWDFYIVYSLFRLAAILQGIAKRATLGTAAGGDAVATGRLARPIGEQAWALARSLAP
jgi:aminoglycoside phosphotransferase (APT) family kinase protein